MGFAASIPPKIASVFSVDKPIEYRRSRYSQSTTEWHKGGHFDALSILLARAALRCLLKR